MTPAPLWIGTAGWSLPSRHATEIPHGGTHLERYSRCLNAVEINSSFYKPHQRKTYERWAQATPSNFRFSVKVPRSMTHDHGLAGCGGMLDRFAAEVTGLGERLGVLLVQLPPSLALDRRVAGRFFRALRQRIDVPIACEPRHASWFEPAADNWLAERDVARVAADPAPAPGAGEPGGSNKLAYYRAHGAPRIYYSNYDDAALMEYHRRIDALRKRRIPTWCIFDNTAHGAALGNALALAGASSPLTPGAGSSSRSRRRCRASSGR
jgi:uncharacterized protein YecE (DUF72 family)